MANANKPCGLAAVGFLQGANWNAKGRVYCIPDTDDTYAYAVGDPVTLAGSADANGIPTITLATGGTGQPLLGAILSPAGAPLYGADYGVPSESPVLIPAVKSRNYYVLVADDPSTIFEVQEDSDAGSIAAASIGLNVNLISGTSNGYVSGWMLDSSSVAAGATVQCKLLRAAPVINNAIGSSYCRFWVLINNHLLAPNTAGV